MITMDVKGITWVGCVYEKFENMCLEVEENMYQDTVKFVEDQVQTVGESVKKFYTDVMQDLLCDSLLDTENLPACGFPIEHYSEFDNYKKSKIRKKKEHLKFAIEGVSGDSELIAVVDKDVDHTRVFHRQHMHSKKNLVLEEIPIKDRLPGANTTVTKDLSRGTLWCSERSNENHDSACRSDNVKIPSTVEGLTSMRERCVTANASQHTDDISIDQQSSDIISLEQMDGERWKQSSVGKLSPESNGVSPSGQVPHEKHADKVSDPNPDMECITKRCKAHFSSSDGKMIHHYLHASDRSFSGLANSSSVGVIESDSGFYGTKTVENSQNSKLEEACVMVSGEELHFIPHMVAKSKPYKNKIPKAFTSRMSAARKQEYEQLALWHGHHTQSYSENGDESKKSLSRDFCESEWEIL